MTFNSTCFLSHTDLLIAEFSFARLNWLSFSGSQKLSFACVNCLMVYSLYLVIISMLEFTEAGISECMNCARFMTAFTAGMAGKNRPLKGQLAKNALRYM